MTKHSWIRKLFSRLRTRPIRKVPQRTRLAVEWLEDRWVPATFIVNNPTDTIIGGETDLRQAIASANSTAGTNTITFDSTVFGTARTITLTSGVLTLTNTATTTITGPAAGVTINGNKATGVFDVPAGANAALSGLTITGGNNSGGGGLYNLGTATLSNCTVSGNTGGGLYTDNALTLIDCTISNNTGFGIRNFDLSLTATGCVISGNTGAGLQNSGYHDVVSLTNCTFSGNLGGGVSSGSFGTQSLTDCTISGNSTTGDGGGIFDYVSHMTLTNCTVSGNNSAGGGGIFMRLSTLNLINSTISGNNASSGGGIYNQLADAGTLTLLNTIVAGNTATTGADILGTISTDFGHNLFGAALSGTTSGTGDIFTNTPLLAPLGDYGGPTQTIALKTGSPAIGAGTTTGAPSTDQRGQARGGSVDIGAYQTQSSPLVVNTGDDNATGIEPAGMLSLRDAINLGNGLGSGTISFDIPGGGPFTITPLAALPTITASLTIDGTTEPGYAGSPLIILDGASAGASVNGLTIGASNAIVKGLEIVSFSADGILLTSGAADNTIGGTAAGAGNVIAFNTGDGVAVTGVSSTGNSIRGNSIYSNGGLGIDLGGTGNNDQAFPVVIAAAVDSSAVGGDPFAGTTQIKATFTGAPNTTYQLDFYDNGTTVDPSGFGQGKTYVGTTTIATDGSGNPTPGSSTFFATLNATLPVGDVLSITATDPSGNTSQFSNDVNSILRPEVVLTGSSNSVRGQLAPYTLTPSASSTDLSAGLTYTVNWGDGNQETDSSSLASYVVRHIFSQAATPYLVQVSVQDQYGFTGLTQSINTQVSVFALENDNTEIDVGGQLGGSTFQLTGVLSTANYTLDTFNLDLDGGTANAANGGLTINYQDPEFTPAVLASLTKFVLWGQNATGTGSNVFDASAYTGTVDIHNGPGNNTLVGSSTGVNNFDYAAHSSDSLLIIAPATATNILSFVGSDQGITFNLGELDGQLQQVTPTGDMLAIAGSLPIPGEPATAGAIDAYVSSDMGDTVTIPSDYTTTYTPDKDLSLTGGAGNDTFTISPATDSSGNDTFQIQNTTYTAGTGNDTFQIGTTGTSNDTFQIQDSTFMGGVGNDTFQIGSSTSNSNDTFTISGSTFDSGAGNDTFQMSAGVSNDTFTIGTGTSFAGNDTFTIGNPTSSGNDTFTINNNGSFAGNDTFTIGSAGVGNDTFTMNNNGTVVGAGNDTFSISDVGAGNDTFTINGGLSAGSGNDTFQIGSTGTTTNDTFTINGGVTAGAGNDTFQIGNNTATGNDTFTINGGVTGGLGNDSFTIQGSTSANDTFTINDGVTLGATGNDTFQIGSVGAGNDTFTLNGSVTGGTGNDTFQIGSVGAGNDTFQITGNVGLGAGNDTFTMQGGGMAGSNDTFTIGGGVTAGSGNDTFLINSPSPTAGNDTFTLNSSFTEGSGNDTFQIENPSMGAGNDTFTMNGSVTGGTGNDTFQVFGSAGTSNDTFTIGSVIAGSSGNDTFTIGSTGTGNDTFTIGNVSAGTSNDTFTIGNTGSGNDTFTMGSVTGGTTSNDTFTIGSFGAGNDTFTLGNVTAGGGNDTFTIGSQAAGNDTFTMGSVTASGTGNDTFTIGSFGAGNDTFTMNGSVDASGTSGNDTFTLGSLGTGNDTFTMNGSVTGGTGNDTFQIQGGSVAGANDTFTISGGVNVGGSTGNDTFTINNPSPGSGNDTFIINSSFTEGSGNDTFTIQNPTTATGNDTFTMNGSVTAGGGNDTFQVFGTAGTSNDTFTIGSVIASSSGNDTFTIGSTGTGHDTFTIGNVTAGTGNDTFTIGNTGTGHDTFTMGSVTAGTTSNDAFTIGSFGAGSDTFTMGNVTAGGGNDTFTIGSQAAGNDTFTMGSVTASGTGNDTFTLGSLGAGNDTFTMNGSVNAGSTSGNDTFTLGSLGTGNDTFTMNGSVTGGTGNDTFQIQGGSVAGANDTFKISGGVDAAGSSGNDTFTINNLSPGSGNDTFTINSSFTEGSGNDTFTIQNPTTGAGNDTFTMNGSVTGGTGNDTFQILGSAGTSNDTFVITGTVNNANSTGNDTFTIGGSGAGNDTFTMNGTVTGGTGNDTFTIGSSGTGNDTFTMGGVTANGSGNDSFTIANLGAGNDTFTMNGSVNAGGTSGNDTFTLGSLGTGNDTFTMNGSVTGGTGNDTFQIQGGSVAGANDTFTISGGVNVGGSSGNDTFTINNLSPGSGNDTFTINSSFTEGSGNDTFTIQNPTTGAGNDTFTMNGSVTGGTGNDTFQILGSAGTSNDTFVITGTVNNANSTGNDTFTIGGSGAGNDTFQMGNITGGTGNDSFTIGSQGVGNDTFTMGGVSSSTSTGNDTFQIGSTGTGNDTFTIGGLTGGSGNDTFVLTQGGGGNDTFTIPNGVSGAGNDTFAINNAGAASGNDTLTINSNLVGGPGNDEFFIQDTGTGSSNDTIIINGNLTAASGSNAVFYLTNNSAGNNTFIVNGALIGGGGSDSFEINNSGNGDDTFIITGGLLDTGDASDTFILSNTGNGDDTFTISDGVTFGSGQDEFSVNALGNGNDAYTVNGNVTLGNGNDTFFTVALEGADNQSFTLSGGVTAGDGSDFFTLGAAGTGNSTFTITGPVAYGAGADSLQLNGNGTGNVTFNLPGGVSGTGYDTYTINDPGAVAGNESFTVNGSMGGGEGNNTFIVTSGLNAFDGTDTFTFNGNLIGGAGFNTFDLADGAINDIFNFIGSLIGGTDDTNDSFQLSGVFGTIHMVSGTGTGTDSYQFTGGVQANVQITAPDQATRYDVLDFSSLTSSVNVDISQTSAQTVAPGLTLQLSDANGISGVVGSAYGNTVHGNARSDTLEGAQSLDSNYDASAPAIGSNGKVQVVMLDFDTAYTAAGGVYDFNSYYGRAGITPLHVYSTAERQAILQVMQNDYAPFLFVPGQNDGGIYFTLSESDAQAMALQYTGSSTQYITEYFDQSVGAGGDEPNPSGTPPGVAATPQYEPGGDSSDLDFRDADMTGTASIQVNGILGEPLEPPATEQNWIAMSAKIAAHELGHLLGLHHEDSFAPIGQGIMPLPDGANYNPPYPGPYDASETFDNIMTSGDTVGANRWNDLRTLDFDEREDIELALAFEAPTTPTPGTLLVPQESGNTSPSTPQAIALQPMSVPNTVDYGTNAGLTFEVQAVDVVGQIGLSPATGLAQSNYYSFTGNQNDLINIDVWSAEISRYKNLGSSGYIDATVTLYYQNPSTGTLTEVNYYGTPAYNDDTYQSSDAQLIDVTLPQTGTYVVQVSSFSYAVAGIAPPTPTQIGTITDPEELQDVEDAINGTDTGNYELFIYRFKAGVTSSGANTFYAGTGGGTIIGAGGNNTLIVDPDVDMVLTNTSLSYSNGTSFTLENIQNADLTIGPDPHQIDVSGWTGGGSLTANSGTLMVNDSMSGLTLNNNSIQSTDGLNLSLSGFDNADLTGSTVQIPDWTGTDTIDGQSGASLVNPVGESFSTVVGDTTDLEPVATFIDSSGTPATGTYSASINWGDQTTSPGVVEINGDTVTIVGTHGYANVGDYPVTVTLQEGTAYSVVVASQATIAADPTTTSVVSSATNDTSVYGQMTTFTASVMPVAPGSGMPTGTVDFVDTTTGQDLGTYALVNGSASVSIATLAAESHTIKAFYVGSNANFIESFGTLIQVINPALLTITANNDSKTYGTSKTFGGTAFTETGLVTVNGDTLIGVTETSTGSPMSAAVGTDPIVPSAATGTGLGNYTINYVNGTLTVNPALLTVTAASPSMTYGGTVPARTYTYTGLVNNDTSATFSGGLTTTATSSSSVGGYSITEGTLTGTGNYAIGTFNPGTLTVNPATLTITANSTSKIYGASETFTSTAFTETGLVTANGDTLTGVTETSTGSTVSAVVGTDPIVPTTATGTGLGNYTISYVNGTLTVNPATLTVTANNISKVFDTANPTFTDTIAGFVNSQSSSVVSGSASLTTSATTTSPVGTYSINAAQGTLSAANYTFAYVNGTLTITLAPTGGTVAYVLNSSAAGALTLTGNAQLDVTGAVDVDSSSTMAISASGNAIVSAGNIQVVGKVQSSGNAHLNPGAVTGAASVPDPLSGLAVPSATGMTNYGAVNLSGNASQTISPGIFSQIIVSGNGKLTMNAGLYIITGGGFSVSGNGIVSGSGVTIYNAGSNFPNSGGTFGSVNFSGNGNISLSPMTTGAYAGILLWQSRDNSSGLSLSGNGIVIPGGVVYAPLAAVTVSGNGQFKGSIIANTLNFSGNTIFSSSSGNGTTGFTPDQIRTAYGINNLTLDGTGQTIAIVDAYDDPSIFQAVDEFDAQFGTTSLGQTLLQQYGSASSFLTVMNENGQTSSLPGTDPAGVGVTNWEMEEELDVEWTHAIAPGAQIILVEANTQSLSDLMTAVATAADQPNVSVVSMSWGFEEGTAVLAQDEAKYDSYLTTPAGHEGVTFVASTGDYGAAVPEYPALSPNVVAVGGTSLTLNADNTYNSETGWGSYSESAGELIGSGGGASEFEAEPSYQDTVQSTGYRTAPDVSFVADPSTGVWIADNYNLSSSDPWQTVGGTSLSAPAWAGLLALTNQGRTAAGETTLGSSSDPTATQTALYSIPASDYNAITTGNNGYSASAGYNLVTGLGTPIANLVVPDLIANNFASSSQRSITVTAATLQEYDGGGGGSGGTNIMNVFDAMSASSSGQAPGIGLVQSDNAGDWNQTAEFPVAGSSSPHASLLNSSGSATVDNDRGNNRLTVGAARIGSIGNGELLPAIEVSSNAPPPNNQAITSTMSTATMSKATGDIGLVAGAASEGETNFQGGFADSQEFSDMLDAFDSSWGNSFVLNGVNLNATNFEGTSVEEFQDKVSD